MDRRAKILDGIEKKHLGIEIAPWFAPLAAKRDGYNVKILDIYDRETLLARAHDDPAISPKTYDLIEEIDFVGSATEICDLVPGDLHGQFDYIISSHNFEHLPNPVKFLQGCQTLLKPGGIISMAVPDGRACFDYFRPHTTIGDWLQAYFEDRQKPTAKQVFDLAAARAVGRIESRDSSVFWAGIAPEAVKTIGDIGSAFRAWQNNANSEIYQDTHCTVMSPASLELLLVECRELGLISLDVHNISNPAGCEFFVRLRNAPRSRPSWDCNHLRSELMRRIWTERAAGYELAAPTGDAQQSAPQTRKSNVIDITSKIFGKRLAKRFRAWSEHRARGQ